MRTYRFAVIPGPGMHGDWYTAIRCTDSRDVAIREAKLATRKHREAMARHGGSSGCFVAVEWDRGRNARVSRVVSLRQVY